MSELVKAAEKVLKEAKAAFWGKVDELVRSEFGIGEVKNADRRGEQVVTGIAL